MPTPPRHAGLSVPRTRNCRQSQGPRWRSSPGCSPKYFAPHSLVRWLLVGICPAACTAMRCTAHGCKGANALTKRQRSSTWRPFAPWLLRDRYPFTCIPPIDFIELRWILRKLSYFIGERNFSMKLLVTSAFVSMFSLGLLGTGSAFADGVSGAGTSAVGSQVTRELSTRTSKQISSAASQATRESAQTR